MSKVQETFKKVISESGLNIAEISRMSGLSDRLMYDIKNGKAGMTLRTIIILCDALEIPYDELVLALIEDTKTTDIYR